MDSIIWIGIVFCISQSAMFSGLNLAFFSISKLRLEIETRKDNDHARKVARLREDSNFLLTTILWGNVGINVLLTLLSNSVMAGVAAFVFSTFLITFLGEIIPQAYFSRHALKMASLLSPALRFYQFLLYPVAKPTAAVLDRWLGAEAIQYFQEKDLREILKLHIDSSEVDIDRVEGKGALNFLAIDDALIGEEGESIGADSIVSLSFVDGRPLFPPFEHTCEDPFLRTLQGKGKKWVILTNPEGGPELVLDSDGFLRSALFEKEAFHPLAFCHRPIIVRDWKTPIGKILAQMKMDPKRPGEDILDRDVILIWSDMKSVVDGSDILGRLMRGIAR